MSDVKIKFNEANKGNSERKENLEWSMQNKTDY